MQRKRHDDGTLKRDDGRVLPSRLPHERPQKPLVLAGLIETADPETGAAETMRFYLPAGVTADDLGLQRVMPCGDGP